MMVLPRLFCSGAVVATVADVDIYLLTVESWNDRVVVRTVGAMTTPAQAIVAEDIARSAEWRQRLQAGANEPPPESAAALLARSLRVDLADTAGTDYRLLARSTGGAYDGGAALYCEWVFAPSLPEAATSIVVTVANADGSAITQTLTAAVGYK